MVGSVGYAERLIPNFTFKGIGWHQENTFSVLVLPYPIQLGSYEFLVYSNPHIIDDLKMVANLPIL